ncbi:MAG: transporter substrate-binding domain-containing protein [Pseudomonadota bacterium]
MSLLKNLKQLGLAILVAISALTGSALSASADGVLEDILKRGTLKVGMSTFVPWAMRDKQGNLIGFEIDVATKVAEDMGVKVEFVPTAWSGIIPALLAKKFDIIIGGMSITPKRNLTVNFTIPYAHSGQQMAASTKLAEGFKSRDDFNQSSVTIACRRGATPCNAAQKLFPKATVRRFDDDAQAFQEVVNGNAHAMISSAPKPRFWSDAYPGKIFLPFGGENLTKGDEGFALRKGDHDAMNFFSNWIRVNTSNGWIGARHDYWFKDQSAWKDMVAPQ